MDREETKLNKINLSLSSMVEVKKGAGADKRHELAVRETLGSLRRQAKGSLRKADVCKDYNGQPAFVRVRNNW